MVNISNEILEKEKETLKNIPLLDIINYIKVSLSVIIQIRAKEEVDKYKTENGKHTKKLNENVAEDYETLLRKEEAEIRQHISIEHQFKIHFESLAEKICELEEDNYLLCKKYVRKIFFKYYIYL